MSQHAEALMAAALAPTRLAVGRRRVRGRTPRAPRGLERRYRAALAAVSNTMAREVMAALRPVLATAQDNPTRQDAILDVGLLFVRIAGLRINLLGIVARALPLLNRTGDQLSEVNRREMLRVLPISISDQSPEVQAAVALWRSDNINLISTMADRLLGDVQSLVTEAASSGMRVETLGRRLQERFRVSKSRANLIARDQILKANADLTRARHLEVGVTEYIWVTSGDERVRPEHRALNGTRQSWENPPDTGNGRNHPGQDIQCRCVARPVLD